MEFYISKETIKRSKFIDINIGNFINLEFKHLSNFKNKI